PGRGKPLTDLEIETVRRWIDAGVPGLGGTAKATEGRVMSPLFERDILPVLSAHCLKCHGTQPPPAGLDLRTAASVLKGSDNGPVVVKGSPEKSFLFQRVSSHTMPPPKENNPVSDDQVETIRKWIAGGALSESGEVTVAPTKSERPEVSDNDRQFWAFRKPVSSAVPNVKGTNRVRTPIDAFVLTKLEAKGLTFSPDAAKRTLLRRAYYDLIGLPPSPEEIQEFVADTRPDAYERLIDRLLASPHYGERWGRHWLDAAGYMDEAHYATDLEGYSGKLWPSGIAAHPPGTARLARGRFHD